MKMSQGMPVESTSNQDTLLPSQRQPMRFSTQSERDSLVGDTGKRYPPPVCSPPPPPSTAAYKDNIPGRPHSDGSSSTPLATRHSAAYYKPYEFTRTGHHQMFRTPPPVTSPPPIPAKATHSSRVLSMYPPYQMPYSTNTYSEPKVTSTPVGYSTPASDSSTRQTKEQQRHSDSGICLEPIRVTGYAVPKEDPLDLFDPLITTESRTVEEYLPETLPPMRERLPSLDLKKKSENSNVNSNSKASSPNSNNLGAEPLVLTGNLITLYDEDVDPADLLPPETTEETRISSEDEDEETGADVEVNPEGSTGSGSSGSDLTSSQEMSSGSKSDDVSMASEEPVVEESYTKKQTGKSKKRYPTTKGLLSMKRSIHKFGKLKQYSEISGCLKHPISVAPINRYSLYKKLMFKIPVGYDIALARFAG